MAPSTSRSSGKIVIKPRRSRGRPRASTNANANASTSTPRATIRIPRAAAVAAAVKREETPSEAPDEDDVSSLTSNLPASSSKAATPQQEEEEDAEDKSEQEEEEQDEDVEVGRQEGDNEEEDVDGDEGVSEAVDEEAVGTPRNGGEEEEPKPVKRGRGRPRGRGRGASVSGSATPRTFRARGRGRGRTRRGRPSGAAKKQADDEGSGADEEGAEEAGGKPFKRVNGKVYIVEGDEYVFVDNLKGDTKIDKNGNLLGGREFKAQTFTLPNRHPEHKYMLAIDAARTSGFRDSLYYFRRNPLALKLNATQWEKDHLIEQGKLGSHLKTRSVTLVTARSAYKLHGAKMIKDGRWIIDDYDEEKVLAEITEKGLKPGELVGDLQDVSNLAAEAAALGISNREPKQERSGATGGAGLGLYRAGGPTTIFGGSGWGPYSDGPLNAVRKSYLNREGVTEENWMLMAAQRTRDTDEEWKKLRRNALKAYGGIFGDIERSGEETNGEAEKGRKRTAGEDGEADVDIVQIEPKRRRMDESKYPLGVYEPQTGIVFYRTDTQPARSRWEPVSDEKSEQRRVLGGSKVGSRAWGLAWVDTVMEPPSREEEEALKRDALLRVKMAEEAEVAEAAAAAQQQSALEVEMVAAEAALTPAAAATPSS